MSFFPFCQSPYVKNKRALQNMWQSKEWKRRRNRKYMNFITNKKLESMLMDAKLGYIHFKPSSRRWSSEKEN